MNFRGFLLPLFGLLLIASCKTSRFEVKDGKTARELLLYNQSVDFLLKEFSNARDLSAQQRTALQLGDSYRKFADYANAEKWYKLAVDLNTGEIALFNLGLMQKQQEKYEEAARTFDQYQKLSGTSFEGRKQLKECRDAVEWKKAFTKLQVRNLTNINSPESDYALSLYKNGAFVFSSSRAASTGDLKDGWTGEKFTDIWLSNSESEAPQNFGTPVNSAAHEGPATFTSDFKEMFFVRCKPEENSNQYCSIYYSAFNNGHWNEPAKLDLFPDSVNVFDPFISRDGKFLLVAANPKDNFGETDLYIVSKADSGWSTPQNLGGGINTPKSERSPWLDEKGTLYFASSGLPGMGGLDIFKTTKTKTGYKDPVNMRAPINSGGDDFGFVIDKYKPTNADDTILMSAYFSSNRAGGKGGDDLYRLEEKWINLFVLKGKVVEKNYEQPENPDSKLLGLKNLAKAKVELRTTDEKVIATTVSDTAGNFTFKLEPETDYKLTASKNGFFNNSTTTLSTKGKKNQDSTIISLYAQVELEKIFPSKEIVIPNIYYDYDKATLRPESQLVLDSILIFFTENPDLKIEIGSHTDSRGSDAYNLKLSQARAQSVVDYLISKKVSNETLQAKGYGETKPTNNCVNGAKCTEEEFQKNRRTTFRVVSSKVNLESIEPENILVDPKKD
ncbi:MAG: OmpA family protein [Bacteroidetes bacterium]|nr:OmpA family protein [Bacteroidota bacterium]